MTTAKEERTRHYKLKADRVQHRIDQIGEEYLDTLAASDDWQKVIDAVWSRINKMKTELLTAAPDRSTPAVIQSALKDSVYGVLTEISRPEFVERTLGIRKRGRR